MVTLSRWERDTVYPTWPFQARIIKYLGYDPFTNPELGKPKGNESTGVALLSCDGPIPVGVALRRHRLELKKNNREFAKELGVDVKTLCNWEAGRHAPLPNFLRRILKFLKP